MLGSIIYVKCEDVEMRRFGCGERKLKDLTTKARKHEEIQGKSSGIRSDRCRMAGNPSLDHEYRNSLTRWYQSLSRPWSADNSFKPL